MKCASVVLAVLGALAGALAAWFWYQSARIVPPSFAGLDSFMGERGESALDKWATDVATKNKWAAGLTAASVLLGGIASVLSTIA